jgi:biopolymer transport protein ExbD
MAELDTSGGGRKKGRGVKKSKKLSTRIDLTPMVDLGFVLITFFIFTTTMTRPTAMKLILPKDTDDDQKQKVKVSAVITIMPGRNDLIYYYEGDSLKNLKSSNFKGIRDIILSKKRRTDTAFFEVILKPTQDASYKNAVDILDEMKIDGVPHYALVDITPDEYRVIQATEQANGIR